MYDVQQTGKLAEVREDFNQEREVLPNDVVILQFLEETDFTDCSAGYSFILRFKSNLFQCNNLPRVDILRFVYNPIRPYNRRKRDMLPMYDLKDDKKDN